MVRGFVSLSFLGLISISIAHAGEVAPTGAGAVGRAPVLSVGNLQEFRSRLIQSNPGTVLNGIDKFIPDSASTVVCKSGVTKCVIQVEVIAQIAAASGESLTVCPLVDGTPIDGGCVNSGTVPPFFLYSAMAFIEKLPGTTHTVGFRSRVSGSGGVLHRFAARYTVLFR